jgi:hypothetical protein
MRHRLRDPITGRFIKKASSNRKRAGRKPSAKRMRGVGVPIVVEDAVDNLIALYYSDVSYSDEAKKELVNALKDANKDYYPDKYSWRTMVNDLFPEDSDKDVPEEYHKVSDEIQRMMVHTSNATFLNPKDRGKDMVLFYVAMNALNMAEQTRKIVEIDGQISDTVEKTHMRIAMIKLGLHHYMEIEYEDEEGEDGDEQ